MQNCKTVRRRAQTFIQTLIHQGIKELPLQKAKDLFSLIADIWDRKSIKAYFGTQAHKSRKAICRRAIYPNTGTVSNKTIELTQEVPTTRGYLEKLGLAEIQQRGNRWFFVVNQDAVMVPQLFKNVVGVPSEISLSPPNIPPINTRKECEKTPYGVVSLSSMEIKKKQTNNNLQEEREKTGSFEPKAEPVPLELTPLEKAILRNASGDG